MPYTNDMATLADVVSPVDAAMQSGQQSGYSNIQDAIKTNIMQQTLPQEVQKASLSNALLNAQGQTQQGIAAQQQAAGKTATAEQPSAQAAGIAGNQAKLSSSQLENLSNIGNTVNKMADFMTGVAPPFRQAYLAQILDENNVKDPALRQGLMSVDPQELPDKLRAIGMGLIQHSANYVQSMDLEQQRGKNQLDVTNAEVAGRKETTEMLVGGRKDVANINKDAKAMMQKTDNIIAQLTAKQAQGALSPDEALTLNQARQAQQLARTNPFINQMIAGEGASAETNQMPVATPGSVTNPGNSGNPLEDEMRRRKLLK